MMMALPVAALLGAFVTIASILPNGLFVAFVSAPFGGSLMALIAGLLLAFLRTRAEHRIEPAPDAYATRSITY
jgi:membrane associated rhomboid family serine protease